MDESRIVSSLIGDIYDASIDPALWPDAIMKLAAFVGGQAGGLVTKDAISRTGTPYFYYGFDPRYVQLYADTHSKFDPLATLPLYDVEQIVSVPDLVPYEEYRSERFFLEWMRPQGWVDAAASVLKNPRRVVRFSPSFGTRRADSWTRKCVGEWRLLCLTCAAPF
jgi:hypothetical protein